MQKLVAKTRAKKYEKMERSIKMISSILLQLMRLHRGRSNAISKDELFHQVYKIRPEILGDLKTYMYWQFIKKGMSYVKNHSRCQIVLERRPDGYYYFVPRTLEETNYYANLLSNTSKKMQQAVKRTRKSVEEKWYAENWYFMP